MKNKTMISKIMAALIIALMMGLTLTACGDKQEAYSDTYDEDDEDEDEDDKSGKEDKDEDKGSTDIDLDALSKSVDDIKNLDLGVNADSKDDDTDNEEAEKEDKTMADEPKGEKTEYDYVDVYRDGNALTVIPNGGLSGITELVNGKSLEGFLDYVDDTVLEEGRTINREMFYELLATMLVDEDYIMNTEYVEKYMLMACAMANNWYDTQITINECYLDANNAADYRYNVTAYGKDDIWLVNYSNRTVYFADGKTEYVSDMFKDEYLAYWLMAIDDYYGITH